MFQAARQHLRAIAVIAVAAALTVGGVAAAQGGSGGEGQGAPGQSASHRPPGPPPAMGIGMKGLTYAQLHVQNKEGEGEVIRIDQGKVKSVDSGSVTVTENDGSEVTIAVDGQTKVLGKPGQETTVGDLEAGQQVSVCGPEGKAAKTIMVMPKKGDLPKTAPGGPLPPTGTPPMGGSSE